ncbi:MAG: hypothetical protein QUS07_05665 [Methanothrix sp.]|nr:hypothetical protein [Methanothrix sp.]
MQARLHPEKKMVPEPPVPTRGGSSPKWGAKLATRARRPVRQNPRSSLRRFVPQPRGQTSHDSMRARAARARAARSQI